ncbi:MAG: hypothetical protein FD175_2955 [Beijerinckiaceae bacterium]|nr:MAG: hypothetical protein FD175_2955 [Beijerinckiaceae bacterium]
MSNHLIRTIDGAVVNIVDDVLAHHDATSDRALEILLQLRDRLGGITDDVLVRVADGLKLSRAELYELATFYPSVRYHPTAVATRAAACEDLVCALVRSPHSAGEREATRDESYLCGGSACRGRCDSAQDVVGTGSNVVHADKADWRTLESYRSAGGYGYVERLRRGDVDAADVLAAIERSGSASSVVRKWRAVRDQHGEPVVIANASEGELGTFKDRHILERDPHGVIDAALVAVAVVGARRLIIYLRDDYDHLYRELQQVINEMRVAGLGADVEFDLRRSGGAYICGEETALIASLEGQRGRPREQPPFPTTHGLFGRPTLVQNIETLYRLRAAWGMRVEASLPVTRLLDPAVRIFSVSGRVCCPGVQLMASLPNIAALIAACGGMTEGEELGGVVLGGAAGSILTAEQCRLPLDDLLRAGIRIGSGSSVIVFAQRDDVRWIAAKMAAFLARESCGQCTPCRVGTSKMAGMLAGGPLDPVLMRSLAEVMREASICGLGRSAGQFLAGAAERLQGSAEC